MKTWWYLCYYWSIILIFFNRKQIGSMRKRRKRTHLTGDLKRMLTVYEKVTYCTVRRFTLTKP